MPTAATQTATVVVAMLTFRRPDALQRVLPELVKQASRVAPPAVIVVVDNDPEGSAAASVGAWAEIVYVHEPSPGLAAARNRALDSAADADAIAFIDDDELPGDTWLQDLVASWRDWKCAAVSGPVLSRFAVTPDPWVVASGLFEPPNRVHGQLVTGAATNNLLLDMHALDRHALRFDQRFGLTGGEDTMLTHALVRAGEQIRWCPTAAVFETVPPERSSKSWVLRRYFRAGTSWSRVELSLARHGPLRLAARAGLVLRGAALGLRGVAKAAVGFLRGDVALSAGGTCDAASYAGMLAGALGHVYEEYRRFDS